MAPVVYGDYTRDRRGAVLGLQVWQLVACGGLLAPVVVVFSVGAWGLLVWTAVLAVVGLPVVLVRPKGRTAAQWVWAGLCYWVGSVRGWTRWSSPVLAGGTVGVAAWPGVLASVVVHDGPGFGPLMRRVALVQDRSRGSWAVTARVRHAGVGMLGAGERDRVGAGLVSALEVLARGGRAEQLVVTLRSVADDGAARAAWVASHADPGAPAAAVRVSSELEAVVTGACVQSEMFVTVVAPERRISRDAARHAPGVTGRARVLHQVIREVETQLVGVVGCQDVAWLTSPELAEAIRTAFAPGDRGYVTAAHLAAAADPRVAVGVPLAAAGPMAALAVARSYRHDAWHSASFVVLLPDDGAVIGALRPVTVTTHPAEGRCLSVFFAVTDPVLAARVSERERTHSGIGAAVDAKLRREPTARQARAAASANARRVKVAAGRTLVRPAVIASVTVPVTESITDAAGRLEASIRQSGFVPQSVDFAQDAAFVAAAVPLGIGLPTRRSGGRP